MIALVTFVEFLILAAMGLVAVGVQGWALSDCLRTPASDFERVYKKTKNFWTALLAGSVFFGFLFVIRLLMTPSNPQMGMGLIFCLAGATAAGVYLADVRPVLAEIRGRGPGRGQQNRGSSW